MKMSNHMVVFSIPRIVNVDLSDTDQNHEIFSKYIFKSEEAKQVFSDVIEKELVRMGLATYGKFNEAEWIAQPPHFIDVSVKFRFCPK